MTITEGKPPLTVRKRIENAGLRLQRQWRIKALNRQVQNQARPDAQENPVVFFNASTRLGGFSQNAAFSLLTAWGLQLVGIPIVHFTCRAGMSRCVLGINLDDPQETPPCETCIAQSKRILEPSQIYWFEKKIETDLRAALAGFSVEALSEYEVAINNSHLAVHGQTIPLGPMVMPSLRWALRRHHLLDDEPTRFLLREVILSAWQILVSFDTFLQQVSPRAVVVFNGTMFPEAVVRWVAIQHGLRVITHEVGFQPFSAFFTDGQATAYPMQIPDNFELKPEQDARLDAYLSQRFKGEFTMAGIQFWPQISGLGEDFLHHARQFRQIVPVFTNVINDTSQIHASSVFAHMYDWLEQVVAIVREHPETLFVIRAHPDEKRRGTRKHSRQPVSEWVTQNGVDQYPNVVFVDSNEPLSSYDLIQKSKFVIVYNSSIGLEASLLGLPVLCGGKARYTQYPTVFFPQTPEAYHKMASEFLAAEGIEVPAVFLRNARRVLYWQLFRTALPFGSFISAHPTPGYVQLKRFSWRELLTSHSTTMRVLADGILNGAQFILPEDSD